MASWSCTTTLDLRPRRQSICGKHFLAALVISLLLHIVIASSLQGGRSHPGSQFIPPLYITARLAQAFPPVLPRAAPAHEDLGSRTRPAANHANARVESTAPAATQRPPESPSLRGASLAEAPDLTYYSARQLDIYPAISTALDLRITDKAAAAGITGRALILVLIDHTGAVDDVSVVEAEPTGYFEDEARRAFMSVRFTPALRNGRAVKSRVLVHIDYQAERVAQ